MLKNRDMDKIVIDENKSYDGYEREVYGAYDLDGNNVYEFELCTYDGMTSINFLDNDGCLDGKVIYFDLEDEDECLQIGITYEDGIEIYDEILTYVNDNGYGFIGEEFE
tara:strand:- start:31 stop:357 length:327 start_codon:yes stop_codon:yes gene_type:complete